jgi:hypothetical protein
VSPPAASPPGVTLDEIERAMAEDRLAGGQRTTTAAAPAPSAPPPFAPAQPSAIPAATPAPSPARGLPALSLDISVIVDLVGGFGLRAPHFLAGDDPDLGGGAAERAAGFTVQEVELGLQAVVDPYFRADIFLTIPNLQGIEVEEAVLTTLSLPAALQARAGMLRSSVGRQNGQHLHLQDFCRRPLLSAVFLGPDGLRAPGLQISWLPPLPFYALVAVEVLSVSEQPGAYPMASFGGGGRQDLTVAASLKPFLPLSETWSLLAGLSFATGVTPGVEVWPDQPPAGGNPAAAGDDAAAASAAATGNPAAAGEPAVVGAGLRAFLAGFDLTLKWRPINVVRGYRQLSWQTEYFVRRIIGEGDVHSQTEGGLYSQLTLQVARRWSIGARVDLLGIPEGDFLRREGRASAALTFASSEFARLRLYGEYEFLCAQDFPELQPTRNALLLLQAEFSIGAHGAHAF